MITGKFGQELLDAKPPPVISGIILAGYGIWKMITVKDQVDQICKKIQDAEMDVFCTNTGGTNPADFVSKVKLL